MASIAGDPFKSFVEDSIRAFKHAIVDLQSNFGRAAKDLESHWPNPRNGARFLQPFSNQDEIVASTASLVRFDRLEGLVDGIRWREADADCFLSQNEGLLFDFSFMFVISISFLICTDRKKKKGIFLL